MMAHPDLCYFANIASFQTFRIGSRVDADLKALLRALLKMAAERPEAVIEALSP